METSDKNKSHVKKFLNINLDWEKNGEPTKHFWTMSSGLNTD